MVRLPTVSEADTRDEFTTPPIGDYELLDFGAGRKLERNIAAMFMVDMSGSTRGWINEAEREARCYLPHVYGAVNDTVIDEVRTLPLKVPDIYRRLTT